MTLEALIEKCTAAGLRVNNLFQRENRMWQANLWEWHGPAHDFGMGNTPVEALQRAFDVVKKPVIEEWESLG
jgi:hypothetical protein